MGEIISVNKTKNVQTRRSWHELTTDMKSETVRLLAQILGEKRMAQLFSKSVRWGNIQTDEPVVLCINRPHFSKDVDELRKRTKTNWISIKLVLLGHAQKAWLPKEFAEQTAFQHSQTEENERYWARLRHFGGYLLDEIEKTAKVDALMIGHIDYWQGEGLRLAAEERNIPLVVLCREHYYLPAQQVFSTKYYQTYRFKGDLVGVMGQQTRNVFVNSGACTAEQVRVLGAPRFDAWRDSDKAADSNTLVLLSFLASGYRAPRLFKQVLDTFVSEARSLEKSVGGGDHGSAPRFVIKAKDRADTANIRAMVGVCPSNLQIDDALPMRPLLESARLIIGFNTLALVEAMMTSARIVIPNWLEGTELSSDLLVFNPDREHCHKAADWPQSATQLQTIMRDVGVRAVAPEATQSAARHETINSIIFRDQSVTSSHLVDEMVRDAIKARKSS